MALQDVPESGVALYNRPQPKDGDVPAQVVRLGLSQSKTKDILKQIRHGEKVVLLTGKQIALQHGAKRLALDISPENYPSSLYSRPHEDQSKMYFAGKLSFQLEAQKAKEDTAKADAALADLQSTLNSMKEEQMNNQTTMVASIKTGKSGQLKPLQSRKDHLLSASSSRPSSPFLGSAFSPAVGPTSNPLLGSSSDSKAKVRFEAMKVPVLHLLASQPMTTSAIIHNIRAPREECETRGS
jgi:RNA polymerase II elongation factor ELL